MKDLSDKITGDQYTAAEFVNFFTENKHQVEGSGQTLNEADAFQLSKSVATYAADGDFYLDTGSATAYVLGLIAPRKGILIYTSGTRVRFKAINTNTGAATVNVNALGVKDIVHDDGSPLKPEQIFQGNFITLIYNGTAFVLIDDGRGSGYTAPLPLNYRSGCLVSNGTDTAHDLDITAGNWRDATDTINLKLLTAFTKEFDVNWAKGSGNGGLAQGLTLTIGKGYYLFLVGGVGKETDIIADEEADASNILADTNIIAEYGVDNIFVRDIHWFLFDTGSTIKQFIMEIVGDQRVTLWKKFVLGLQKVDGALTAIKNTVPIDYMINKNVIGLFNATYLTLSSTPITTRGCNIFPADLDDQVPNPGGGEGATLVSQAGETFIMSDLEKKLVANVDGKPRLSYHQLSTDTPRELNIFCRGWID
jgi:hypothetical protein